MNQVIVTGASRGLGLVTANHFASQGWQVHAIGLSDRPEDLAKSVEYSQFDLADPEAANSFWQQFATKHADDSISLINNAGGFAADDLAEAKLDDFHKQMTINYFTGVTMTHSLVRHLPKARIINIVSAAALAPSPHMSAYGASKAAAKHFYQSLQRELSKDKYRITNVYPDMMATGGDNVSGIDPLDVAKLVFWQASQASSYYQTDVTINAL